jgi:hypothetical protein
MWKGKKVQKEFKKFRNWNEKNDTGVFISL